MTKSHQQVPQAASVKQIARFVRRRTQKVDSSKTQNYVTDGSSPASAVLKDGNAVYTPGL